MTALARTLCWLALINQLGADQPDRWSQVYPRPTGQTLRDVASDGTNWVAVGQAGTILVSPDGTNWSVVASGVPANRNLMAVTFSAGKWVAVGSGGTIVSSSNATEWVSCASGTTEALNAVAYGSDRYVAVGAYGVVVSSTNSLDWKLESGSSPWSPSLMGLAYGKGLFVAGGLGTLQTSPDGISWAPQSFEPAHDIHSVWFEGTQFLAGRLFGVVFVSTDGTNWVAPGGFSSTYITSFTKLGNRWLAAAGELWQSADLTNWTTVNTGAYSSTSAGGISAARAVGDKLVIAGEAGNVLVSSDATNFVQCRAGRPLNLSLMLTHGERTLGFVSSGLTVTSSDGYTWTEGSFGAAGFFPMDGLSDGKRVVVVGSYYSAPTFTSNEIRTSEDGLQWTSYRLRSRGGLLGVTFGANLYVAAGSSGVVHTSSNGAAWTSNAIPGTPKLNSVAAGGGRFVAVGPPGTNYVSTDASQWIATNSYSTKELVSVAYGAGRFVAVGRTGTVVTSEDGNLWQAVASGTTADFRRVEFVNEQFFAATSGSLLGSPDGLSWETLTNAPANTRSMAAAPGALVVASADAIYRSSPLPPRIAPTVLSRDGHIGLGITSQVGDVCRLESTLDFTHWASRATLTNTLGFGWTAIPSDETGEYFRVATVPP